MGNFDQYAGTYKCPGCQANLFFDTDSGKLKCKFCGCDYEPTIFGMLEAFESSEKEADASEDDSRHEIVCSSCGAVVITDENTSSSICCFCGSPAMSARRLTKEFRPDYIIPFKLTKEDAKAKFIEWASNNPYIPDDFTSDENINKLTGLYVPFWLVDCRCDTEFDGTGYLKQGEGKATFALERSISFFLSRVPYDGSRKISDRLMRAVEPFDYSEMKEYKDSYLPGFYAERYDQTPYELSENVYNRMHNYAEEFVKVLSCAKYDEVRFSTVNAEIKDIRHSYALLPVWFMNYQYNGVNYGFAINGQTGEACGDLPYSEAKRKKKLAKTVLLNLVLPGIPALLYFLSFFIYLFVVYTLPPETTTEVVYKLSYNNLALCFCYASPYLGLVPIALILRRFRRKWYAALNETQNPIDPPPPVEEYYDSTKKPEIKAVDKFVSVIPRVKDDSNTSLLDKLFG